MSQVKTVADLHARAKTVLQPRYPSAETSETGDKMLYQTWLE
jgi:hypothetical protein